MQMTFNPGAALLTAGVFAVIAIGGWLGVPSHVAISALVLVTAFELITFFGSHGGGRRFER